MKIKFSTRAKKIAIVTILFLGIMFSLPNLFIMANAFLGGKIISSDENIKSFFLEKDLAVAIAFGASAPYDTPSTIFSDRLKVASELYFSGKVKKILVSGDNSLETYNEPNAGKIFLEEQGVPLEDIILDYAGFRTYDTCIRAKKIFGVNQAYLVTQEFHLPRAIFLCEDAGIEVVGVSASLQDYTGTLKNIFRETLAQQQAFYEVFVFPHDPKFLGEEEFIFE